MRAACRATASAALLLLFASAPVSGQGYRGGIGLYGGGSMFSDFAPGGPQESRLATDWIAGLSVDSWAGRFGLRVNASYTERGDENDYGGFNIYAANVDLLIRLLRPNTARMFVPYIAVGGGAVHFNSAVGNPVIGGGIFAQDPVTKPFASAGLGVDLFAANPIGLRLEVVDQMMFESPFVGGATDGFRPVHHAIATLGLQIRSDKLPEDTPVLAFSRERRPEPEPREAPPPPARPVEDVPPTRAAREPRDPGDAEMLAGVTAALQANTTELARLRERVTELERRVDQALAAPGMMAMQQTTVSRPAGGASGTGLYTVQIAAFEQVRPAQDLAERMRRSRLPAWVTEIVIRGRTYYRVRVGAVPNLAEARSLGERIRQEYRSPIWVAPVTGSDVLPADAVPATRAYLRSS